MALLAYINDLRGSVRILARLFADNIIVFRSHNQIDTLQQTDFTNTYTIQNDGGKTEMKPDYFTGKTQFSSHIHYTTPPSAP